MAIKGHSTVVQYGNTADWATSNSWTDLASEIIEVTPPESEADDIETSHMESAEQHRTYIAGWSDGGEAEMTAYYSAAQLATIQGFYRTTKAFRVVFSDSSVVKFNGYIKNFGAPVDMEGLTEMTVTIKVSGEVEPDTNLT